MARTSPITRYKKKLMTSIVTSPELIELVNDDYIDKDGECVELQIDSSLHAEH